MGDYMKKIIKIIKKIIFSALLLYGYNVITAPLNVIIPLNFINIGLMTFLGIPALFALIFIKIIVF
jgi:hypothetical protein